jgi:hypothetical protein
MFFSPFFPFCKCVRKGDREITKGDKGIPGTKRYSLILPLISISLLSPYPP